MPGLMPNRRAGVEIVFKECENFCLSGSRLARITHSVGAQLLILCSTMHTKVAYETPKACGVSRWGNRVVVVKMRKTTVCPCTGLAGVANRVVQVGTCLLYDHIMSSPRPRHPPAVLPCFFRCRASHAFGHVLGCDERTLSTSACPSGRRQSPSMTCYRTTV